tara:strand:- start:159 stop:806 length:648 start_codon:yes stop_codon:yes gene_type:complete
MKKLLIISILFWIFEIDANDKHEKTIYLQCPLVEGQISRVDWAPRFYLVELNTINDKPVESFVEYGTDDIIKESLSSFDSDGYPFNDLDIDYCTDRRGEYCKVENGRAYFRRNFTSERLKKNIPIYENKWIYFNRTNESKLCINRETLRMGASSYSCPSIEISVYTNIYQCDLISKDKYKNIKSDFSRQLDIYIKARQKYILDKEESESMENNKI